MSGVLTVNDTKKGVLKICMILMTTKQREEDSFEILPESQHCPREPSIVLTPLEIFG